jgi:phage terminase large subunit
MIILHNKQSEAIKSNKRYKLLNWGRRSGKTSLIAYEALIDLYNNDKALVSYYAPTTTDARDIAWEIFKETLDKLIIKTNEVLLEIKVRNKFGGESTLRLAGWEAVKNRDKGRGVENTLVILDEVAFYPEFKEKFEKVIEPTLLTSKGRLILTSTPNGFNHFYDKYNEALNNDMWFVSHATSYDNPKNDPEELARLRKEKDQDVFAQEYLADFRKIQGLVYKDFDRERHTYDPDTAKINKVNEIAGIDWGYTNPLVMLRIYVDNDNNFFIHDEYYRTEKTTEEAIEFLGTWKPTCVYPDPAEPDRNAMVAKAGYYVKDVNKDIKSGIDKVISLFRNNKIFISKACTNLINELESYRYDEKLSKEIPVKENDHAMDALRYALFMHTGSIPVARNQRINTPKVANKAL